MTVSIPKRKFKIEIEGKIFEANELSLYYLTNATVNPDSDTIDAAIADALPDISDEDYKLFGVDTKSRIYQELVKFTFREPVTAEKRIRIAKATGLSEEEMRNLSRDSILQLNAIIEERNKDAVASASKKKTSSKRSPE